MMEKLQGTRPHLRGFLFLFLKKEMKILVVVLLLTQKYYMHKGRKGSTFMEQFRSGMKNESDKKP